MLNSYMSWLLFKPIYSYNKLAPHEFHSWGAFIINNVNRVCLITLNHYLNPILLRYSLHFHLQLILQKQQNHHQNCHIHHNADEVFVTPRVVSVLLQIQFPLGLHEAKINNSKPNSISCCAAA
jgi:hypothetical protein